MNGLPYYKAYPRDFIEGTIGMPLELKGAYRVLLDLIYMQGGKCPDDPRYISGLLGCSIRKWKSIRSRLISEGKVVVQNGCLTNYRAEKELETLSNRQEQQRQNARGPRKNKDLEKPRLNHTEPEPDKDKEYSAFVNKLTNAQGTNSDGKSEAKSGTLPGLGDVVSIKVCGMPFSEFWSAWPVKKGKAAAEKAWRKLKPSEQKLAADAAASWFASWRQQHPKASPILPATYLNQRRWEDEEDLEPKTAEKISRWDRYGRRNGGVGE